MFSKKIWNPYIFELSYRTYNKTHIMKTKKCTRCKTERSIDRFYPRKKLNKKGEVTHQSWCKDCYNSPEMQEYRRNKMDEWRETNPEKYYNYFYKYRSRDREGYNNLVYNWMKNNIDTTLDIQKKYQSKIPPGVYSISYKGKVIYVGATNQPIRRANVHLSTIKTKNNISKINRLHSFLGYDKSDFTFTIIEHCDVELLIERERYYRKKLKSKENYKRIFGKVETTKSIINRLGLTSNTNRKKWRD